MSDESSEEQQRGAGVVTRYSVREVRGAARTRFEVVNAAGQVILSTLTPELAHSCAALFNVADERYTLTAEQVDADRWK